MTSIQLSRNISHHYIGVFSGLSGIHCLGSLFTATIDRMSVLVSVPVVCWCRWCAGAGVGVPVSLPLPLPLLVSLLVPLPIPVPVLRTENLKPGFLIDLMQDLVLVDSTPVRGNLSA